MGRVPGPVKAVGEKALVDRMLKALVTVIMGVGTRG